MNGLNAGGATQTLGKRDILKNAKSDPLHREIWGYRDYVAVCLIEGRFLRRLARSTPASGTIYGATPFSGIQSEGIRLGFRPRDAHRKTSLFGGSPGLCQSRLVSRTVSWIRGRMPWTESKGSLLTRKIFPSMFYYGLLPRRDPLTTSDLRYALAAGVGGPELDEVNLSDIENMISRIKIDIS